MRAGRRCAGQDLQGLPQSEAEMRRIVGRGGGGKQRVFRVRSNRYGIAGEVSGRVEKMGTELVKINKKLGAIDGVLCEGAIEEADEIANEGLNNEWYDAWRDEEMVEEVRGLEEENKVFLEFCREYEKGQEEEQGQVQVQEQEQEQGQEAE